MHSRTIFAICWFVPTFSRKVPILTFPLESVLAKGDCISCQKNRTNPDGSGYESLVKNMTNDGSEFLLSYASSSKNDYLSVQLYGLSVAQVLAKKFYFYCTPATVLAKKFYFHRICSIKSKDEAAKTSQKCFENLKDFIQRHIIDQREVMKVSKITAIYEGYQSSAGVPVKGASNRLIKTRLKKSFEEKLSFYKQSKTSSELIYSNAPLHESGNTMPFHTLSDLEAIETAVEILRTKINLCVELFSSWPPASEKLINAKCHIS